MSEILSEKEVVAKMDSLGFVDAGTMADIATGALPLSRGLLILSDASDNPTLHHVVELIEAKPNTVTVKLMSPVIMGPAVFSKSRRVWAAKEQNND